MDNQELKRRRDATIEHTRDETTWGGPAGDILTGIRNTEHAPAERAIWELVQNARDVSWEDEKATVSFKITEEGFVFCHQGKPFTNTSLESLIKQTSSKVRSDIRTVGKYGTGFLVTHQFGRMIKLSGKLQVVDGEDLFYSFANFEMDRSSDDKETLKECLKAQSKETKSWGYEATELDNDGHGETRFLYCAQKNEEWKAIDRAFSTASRQAPYVLVANSRLLQEISFEDLDGSISRYSLGDVVDEQVEEGEQYTLRRTEVNRERSGQEETEDIYYLQSKETDERIGEGIVTVILPIKSKEDGGYEAFRYEEGISHLYLSLPLVGTEEWGLNLIVHSPLFECENDSRNGLRIVPEVEGVVDNDNRRVLDVAFNITKEWLGKSLGVVKERKYLGQVCFVNTSKNPVVASFNEQMQERWVAMMMNLPIAKNEQKDDIEPKNLFVLDDKLTEYAETHEDFRRAIYETMQYVYSEKIPEYDDLIFWSRQISDWRTDEGACHILGIEQIVKDIAAIGWNDKEGGLPEEWIGYLKSIATYLIESGETQCLGYSISPNEAGELHEIKDLKIPTEFTAAYRAVIDTIVPEEKEKFIHPSFKPIGIPNLGTYGEQDAKAAITSKLSELQNAVNTKLKGIATAAKAGRFDASDATWEEVIDARVLKAIIKLFAMWAGEQKENLESKLLRLYCEYLGMDIPTGETIRKEYFTDGEQMWRTCLFEIVYRFVRLSDEEQAEKREWHKGLMRVLKEYSATEEYLERFMLFPDQTGKLRLASDLVSGVGIQEEMKEYYDELVADEGKGIKTQLVMDDFAPYLPHENAWDNQTVGGKIENEVSRVAGYPDLSKYAKKSEVLQIVKRFGTETEEGRKWMSYFKMLSEHKSRILLTFAESDSVFNLLLQPEARLKVLSDIATDQRCEEILTVAKKVLAQKLLDDADMQYKRELGLYVEKYLVDQLGVLLKENETIKAECGKDEVTDKDEQGGQDIVVYLGDKPVYYIEVKSRWSTRDSVEMSRMQMEKSAAEKEHYALCEVSMSDYDKEKVFRKEYPQTFDEIKGRISVVLEIGERNAGLLPVIEDSKTEVHIGGEIKSVVPQGYIQKVKVSVDDLMKAIERKVKDVIG